MRRPGHAQVSHQERPATPASPSSSICASPLSLSRSLLRPRAAATSAAVYHYWPSSAARRQPNPPSNLAPEGAICFLFAFPTLCARSTVRVSTVATPAAHRSMAELRRAPCSRGPAVSDLHLSCFLAHCNRLASPHLLRPIAATLLAGVASSAVSRAAAPPCALSGALQSLRAAIEGTPECARVRGMRWWRCRLRRCHRRRVPVYRSSSSLLCATDSVGSGPTCLS